MSNSRLTRFINELRTEEALCTPGETAHLTLGQIQEAADYLEEFEELQNEPFKKINDDELIDELEKRGHTVITQRNGYTQVLVARRCNRLLCLPILSVKIF